MFKQKNFFFFFKPTSPLNQFENLKCQTRVDDEVLRGPSGFYEPRNTLTSSHGRILFVDEALNSRSRRPNLLHLHRLVGIVTRTVAIYDASPVASIDAN